MKILRKAGTMFVAAVMCLSSFFAESVYAQKSDKELIFEYVLRLLQTLHLHRRRMVFTRFIV